MRVKATANGYYAEKRVKPGEMFDLQEDSHFSDRWMEKVSGKDGSDELAIVSQQRSRPARVQAAPDARDVEKVLNDQLGEERINYSTGTQVNVKPAAIVPKGEGEDHLSGAPKRRGRPRKMSTKAHQAHKQSSEE